MVAVLLLRHFGIRNAREMHREMAVVVRVSCFGDCPVRSGHAGKGGYGMDRYEILGVCRALKEASPFGRVRI